MEWTQGTIQRCRHTPSLAHGTHSHKRWPSPQPMQEPLNKPGTEVSRSTLSASPISDAVDSSCCRHCNKCNDNSLIYTGTNTITVFILAQQQTVAPEFQSAMMRGVDNPRTQSIHSDHVGKQWPLASQLSQPVNTTGGYVNRPALCVLQHPTNSRPCTVHARTRALSCVTEPMSTYHCSLSPWSRVTPPPASLDAVRAGVEKRQPPQCFLCLCLAEPLVHCVHPQHSMHWRLFSVYHNALGKVYMPGNNTGSQNTPCERTLLHDGPRCILGNHQLHARFITGPRRFLR